MGLGKQQEKLSGARAFWPVLGFLMLVALGVIAWFLAPEAQRLARRLFPAFTGGELEPWQIRAMFAFLVFVVFIGIASAIVAIAAPRRALNVREGDLAKERAHMIKEQTAARKRRRKLNRERYMVNTDKK
jgi:hypothetical protein